MLNQLDLSTYPYDEVKFLISHFHTKILRISIPAGELIERIRPDVGIYERKDVYYRPASQNKKPQRANLPGRTAFYGTLCHHEESGTNRRAIALFETSKLFKENKNANGTEQFTLSRWMIKNEIKLAEFAHETVYPNATNNKLLVTAKNELIMNKNIMADVLEYDEYIRYMTEQFAKNVDTQCDYEYIISATIAEKLMGTDGLDGVMYPSVPTRGQYGMNVALRDDVADTKLKLVDVHEMEYDPIDRFFSFIGDSVPISIDKYGYKKWYYIPHVRN